MEPTVETPSPVLDAGTTPAAPAPESPSAPQSFEQAQETHAAARLERIVERGEGAAPAAASAPERPVATPAHRQQPSAPAPTPAAPPQPLWAHPASQGFMSRINRRAEQRAQAELAQRIESAFAQVPQQEPAQAVPDDPQPDFDSDPQAWYLWQNRQQEARIQQMLQPVVERERRDQETAAQHAARVQQEEAQAEWGQQMAEEMNFARQLYAQTPEGELFDHRFAWFVNDMSARGLIRNGVEPELATAMASRGMQAWTDYAIRHNINPAVFIDGLIRHQITETAQVLLDAGWTPPGQNGPQRPARQPRPQQEIASLRETGNGASSVAGVVRNSTASGPQGSGISLVLASPTVENIRAFAEAEFGGDVKKANAAVRKAMATAGGGFTG